MVTEDEGSQSCGAWMEQTPRVTCDDGSCLVASCERHFSWSGHFSALSYWNGTASNVASCNAEGEALSRHPHRCGRFLEGRHLLDVCVFVLGRGPERTHLRSRLSHRAVLGARARPFTEAPAWYLTKAELAEVGVCRQRRASPRQPVPTATEFSILCCWPNPIRNVVVGGGCHLHLSPHSRSAALGRIFTVLTQKVCAGTSSADVAIAADFFSTDAREPSQFDQVSGSSSTSRHEAPRWVASFCSRSRV